MYLCTCGRLRARAVNFFALAEHSHPKVLVGRFSDVEVQCTSRWLILGCSHYALPEGQCTSKGGGCWGAEVKVR
jgi:hypothetical protein